MLIRDDGASTRETRVIHRLGQGSDHAFAASDDVVVALTCEIAEIHDAAIGLSTKGRPFSGPPHGRRNRTDEVLVRRISRATVREGRVELIRSADQRLAPRSNIGLGAKIMFHPPSVDEWPRATASAGPCRTSHRACRRRTGRATMQPCHFAKPRCTKSFRLGSVGACVTSSPSERSTWTRSKPIPPSASNRRRAMAGITACRSTR
jgi:hypothetical protein